MRILLDTDVLLDVALARERFAADGADVLRWAESGGAAAVAWHSLTNCAYLLKGGGRPFLERLLRLVEVAPVASADARRAVDLPLSDVEDVGRDQHKVVHGQPATIEDFTRLLAELRVLLARARLDPDTKDAIDADFKMVEAQVQKPEPKRSLIEPKLKSIAGVLG
ncbi:MAG: PIN domain-containing protein, partial [Gammaproteobacteria bacterium]